MSELQNKKKRAQEFAEILNLPEVKGGGSLLEAMEEMEKENTTLRDKIKEERFIWGVSFVLVFNIMIFSTLDGIASIAIVLIQFLVFLLLAKRSGVEEIVKISTSLFQTIYKN